MELLKGKVRLYSNYIKYYISQNIFKEIYILAILIALYGGFLSRVNVDVFSGFFATFGFPTFVIIYFLINIINTIMFIKFLNSVSFFYDIRINDKNKVLSEKIIMSLLLCAYFNVLFFLVLFSLIFMFNGGYIDGKNYYNYDVSKMFYFMYSFIRLILLNCLLTIYNVIILEKYGLKVIIFDFLFLLGLRINFVRDGLKISFNIYDMLTFTKFESFKYDLLSSIIMITILLIFSVFLVKIKMKKHANIKAIMISDFKYVTNKKINVLFIYLILHLVLFIVFKNLKSNYEDILGLNFDFNNFNLISFLIFLFSDITYIFMFINLLEKDMEYMYSVIFCRLNLSDWLFSKIMSFLFVIFLLKIFDYTMFFLIFNVSLSLVFKYLCVDILNILLIESYIIIISLFKKKKNIYFILFIFMIVLLPKNVMSLYNYKYWIVSLFFIINIILYIVFRVKNNTIFSLIGGNYDRNKKYC